MHVKRENNAVCNKPVRKEALPTKMLNLILSLFNLFHSFKFCSCPAEKIKKKIFICGLEEISSKHTGTHAVKRDKYLL